MHKQLDHFSPFEYLLTMKNELETKAKSEQSTRDHGPAVQGDKTMQKNSKAQSPKHTTAAAVREPAPATTAPVQSATATAPRLAKDDFYEITARAEGGAVKLAVFNRRKDEALRIVEAAHKNGSDMGAALSRAFAVAFPRRPSTQSNG